MLDIHGAPAFGDIVASAIGSLSDGARPPLAHVRLIDTNITNAGIGALVSGVRATLTSLELGYSSQVTNATASSSSDTSGGSGASYGGVLPRFGDGGLYEIARHCGSPDALANPNGALRRGTIGGAFAATIGEGFEGVGIPHTAGGDTVGVNATPAAAEDAAPATTPAGASASARAGLRRLIVRNVTHVSDDGVLVLIAAVGGDLTSLSLQGCLSVGSAW